MNNTFTVNHEDILSFLEDNISKLVKLKAASRDKYKEYDDNFMSYITAENIDDEHRIGLYAELTELSYDWMKNKLMKAIEKDASLILNPIVTEYFKLMTDNTKNDASASLEDSPVPKYTDFFEDMEATKIIERFCNPQLDLRQKVGRNDPCPCGSGKKYKNCCGKN